MWKIDWKATGKDLESNWKGCENKLEENWKEIETNWKNNGNEVWMFLLNEYTLLKQWTTLIKIITISKKNKKKLIKSFL